ncbi:Mechanosensitive ion channel [seawater metagenome]|uniref:Mechanosensitive ion channel n=1 Tax=seawater metagenome TaxID=1561972 RepID=A0A5E8CH08_9ZZZZ
MLEQINNEFNKYFLVKLKHIPNLVEIVLIRGILLVILFLFGNFFIKLINYLISKIIKPSKNESEYNNDIILDFILKTVKRIIYIIYACIFLRLIGVKTTTLLTLIGTGGLAIGFSLKDSLSNFAAGILIISVIQPFQKGDYVEIANTQGTIDEIGNFTTKLIEPSGNIIFIANSNIINSKIINFTNTNNKKFRNQIEFKVKYDSDISKLLNYIETDILKKDKRILEETYKSVIPAVAIEKYDQTSIQITIRYYTLIQNKFPVYYELMKIIREDLYEKKILNVDIPQLTVYLDK